MAKLTTLTLTQQDIDDLKAALDYVLQLPLNIDSIRESHFPLCHFNQKLKQVTELCESGPGIICITGLPIDRFSITQLEYLFMGIGQHLGTPVSQSHLGEMMYHVEDKGYIIGQKEARGPNTKQALHFHSDRADVIGFLCVHQAATGGVNQFVDAHQLHDIVAKKRPDLLKALYQDYYWQRHNVDAGMGRHYNQYPIFSNEKGVFVCQYLRELKDRALTDPSIPNISNVQIEAMDYIDDLMLNGNIAITHKQQPGEMLFLNNYTTLHSRSTFSEGQDRRLLLRLWLSMPNSRPLPESFRAVYGNVEPGAVRGGMMPQREL